MDQTEEFSDDDTVSITTPRTDLYHLLSRSQRSDVTIRIDDFTPKVPTAGVFGEDSRVLLQFKETSRSSRRVVNTLVVDEESLLQQEPVATNNYPSNPLPIYSNSEPRPNLPATNENIASFSSATSSVSGERSSTSRKQSMVQVAPSFSAGYGVEGEAKYSANFSTARSKGPNRGSVMSAGNEQSIFSESMSRSFEPFADEPTKEMSSTGSRDLLLRQKIKKDLRKAFGLLNLQLASPISKENFGSILSEYGISLNSQLLQEAFDLVEDLSSPNSERPEALFSGCLLFLFAVYGVEVHCQSSRRGLITEVQKYRMVSGNRQLSRNFMPLPQQSERVISLALDSPHKEPSSRSRTRVQANNSCADDVFNRLHGDAKRNDTYKSRDCRTSEQKIVEEHCTFNPKTSVSSPFLSRRESKSSSVHNDSAKQMFDGLSSNRSQSGTFKSRESSLLFNFSGNSSDIAPFYHFKGGTEEGIPLQSFFSSNTDEPAVVVPESTNERRDFQRQPQGVDVGLQGGLFIPGFGLLRGPPASAGIPLFHFNPLHPPSFELGSYLTCSTVMATPVNITDDEMSSEEEVVAAGPTAPPLPSWAYVAGGDPDRSKSAKESSAVLPLPKKQAQPQEKPATEATGWQKVMEEFAARRGSMTMKKVKVEEKKPVGKLKKGGKKKEGFNDIIDELSHRLARMRGEIVDDEEEETVSVPAPAPPPLKQVKPVADTVPVPAAVTQHQPQGNNLKPARPLCENIPPPPFLNINHPIFKVLNNSAVEPPPAAPVPVPGLQLCSYPLAVPQPSALPAPPPLPSQWPPIAFKLAAPKKKKRNSKSKRRMSRKSFQSSSIVTTASKLLPGYYMPCSDINAVPAGEVVSAGFTSPEMCIVTAAPSNSAVTRGNASGSASSPPLQNTMGSTNSVPMPGSIRPGIPARKFVPNLSSSQRRPQDATEGDVNSIDDFSCSDKKKVNVEDLPLPTNFHDTIRRMQQANKLREDRLHQAKATELRHYPSGNSLGGMARAERTVPSSFQSNVSKRAEAKAHSYRKPVGTSQCDNLPQSQRVPSMTNSAKMLGINDTAASFFLTTLRDGVSSGGVPPSSRAVYGQEQQQSMSQSENYSKTPTFFHTIGVERRNSERKSRKERENMEAAAMAERDKAHRRQLHHQAMQSAVMSGAFDPAARVVHSHEKLLLKYSQNLDSSAVDYARRQYSAKHSLYSASVQTSQ